MMPKNGSEGFVLDRRLESGSEHVMLLGLCEMRLMNDCRWPWLVLVPQRPGIEEIHEMAPLDQAMLTFETNIVADTLKKQTRCDKINVAALGNVVSQLHIHIVARNRDDPAWPGPVWGFGEAEPYPSSALADFIEKLRGSF